MELALTFVAERDRRLFALWGALLHQLCDATFDIGEPHVAQAKLAWWQQELERGRSGEASHPLARELFMHETVRSVRAACWQALSGAALQFAATAAFASDTRELLASRHPIATAIAGVESELFSGVSDVTGIQRGLVLRQMRTGTAGACWPLNLRARLQLGADHAGPAAHAALASALACELPDGTGPVSRAVLFRRLRNATDHWQLLRVRATGRFHARPSLRLAWTLWRVARANA